MSRVLKEGSYMVSRLEEEKRKHVSFLLKIGLFSSACQILWKTNHESEILKVLTH